MNANDYRRLSDKERSRDGGARLRAVDRFCVGAVALAYVGVLLWLAVSGDARLWATLVGPASGFAALSAVRKILNRPRPYEGLPIQPLLDAHEEGASFPSRHVFSGMLIAVALMPVQPVLAAVLGVLSLVLARVRVVGGVHWPADVIAGAVAGALWGVLALAICGACGLPL